MIIIVIMIIIIIIIIIIIVTVLLLLLLIPSLFTPAAVSSEVFSRDFIRYLIDRDDDDDVCMMGVVFKKDRCGTNRKDDRYHRDTLSI